MQCYYLMHILPQSTFRQNLDGFEKNLHFKFSRMADVKVVYSQSRTETHISRLTSCKGQVIPQALRHSYYVTVITSQLFPPGITP